MNPIKNCVLLSVATAGMTSTAFCQTISVNFATSQAGDGILGAGDIAGFLPSGNWNNSDGVSGSLGSLITSSGASTGVGVSWSVASGLWSTNQESDTNQFGGGTGPNHTMMSGYLDYFVGNPATITFSGLVPLTPVNLYVYSLTAVDGRQSGEWSVNGGAPQQAISLISTSFDPGGPDLTPGVVDGGEPGNYLRFSSVANASGNIVLSSTGLEFRAAVNGIQLQIIPEPSAISLALLGTAGFMGRRRRR